jgi:hypothetical protein
MNKRGSVTDWSTRIGANAARLRARYQFLTRVHLVWVIPAAVFGAIRLVSASPLWGGWIPILIVCFIISAVALPLSWRASKQMIDAASRGLTDANTPRSIRIGPVGLSTIESFDGWTAQHSIKWVPATTSEASAARA